MNSGLDSTDGTFGSIGGAFLLRLVEGGLGHQQALALVLIAGPVKTDHHGAERAVFPGPTRKSHVAGRQKDQLIQIGTC
jgi:hypothetical protein